MWFIQTLVAACAKYQTPEGYCMDECVFPYPFKDESTMTCGVKCPSSTYVKSGSIYECVKCTGNATFTNATGVYDQGECIGQAACPEGTYYVKSGVATFGMCQKICWGAQAKFELTDQNGAQCVSQCPSTYYKVIGHTFVCVDFCEIPNSRIMEDGQGQSICLPDCPQYKSPTEECWDKCQDSHTIPTHAYTNPDNKLKYCLFQCPGNARYIDSETSECKAACPSGFFERVTGMLGQLNYKCALCDPKVNLTESSADGMKRCLSQCDSGSFQLEPEHICVGVCPDQLPWAEEGMCVASCSAGYLKFEDQKLCYQQCPDNLWGFNQTCVPQCPQNMKENPATRTCEDSEPPKNGVPNLAWIIVGSVGGAIALGLGIWTLVWCLKARKAPKYETIPK